MAAGAVFVQMGINLFLQHVRRIIIYKLFCHWFVIPSTLEAGCWGNENPIKEAISFRDVTNVNDFCYDPAQKEKESLLKRHEHVKGCK